MKRGTDEAQSARASRRQIKCVFAVVLCGVEGEFGFPLCWSRTGGFSYKACCADGGRADCFDAVFTYERCCDETDDYDPACVVVARTNMDQTITHMSNVAIALGDRDVEAQVHLLKRYNKDDGIRYVFCCAGFHNEYCWGPALPERLLPDQDSWGGRSDITGWYARCCFPRLRAMLQAPAPPWMRRQITRDFMAWPQPGEGPSNISLEKFGHQSAERLCEFHISPGGRVRHCNYTERGLDPRRDSRARIFARAIQILAVRGELPETTFSFIISFDDVEWEDLPMPVLAFCRGKAARRVARVPMFDNLDGGWARKVEQMVLEHELAFSWHQKRGRWAFWRGTDSGVPAPPDCHPKYGPCEVSAATVHHFPRLRAVQLSHLAPTRVNARLSGVKPSSHEAGHHLLYKDLGLLSGRPRDWSIKEQLRFRYLLDIEGSAQSTRLHWALLSKSLVFRQSAQSCSWYSDALRPYKHFIPVRRDLADLPAQVAWARRNPVRAERIARRSATMARKRLSHEDAMHYLARMLHYLAAVATGDLQRRPNR